MTANTENILPTDCVKLLTSAQSKRNVIFMRPGDIDDGLQKAYQDAFARLSAIHDEQNTIRSQYRRYLDLDADAKRYETRIRRIVGALQHHAEKWPKGGADVVTGYGKDFFDAIAVAVRQRNVPLWEIIAVLLEETGEIQVIELENLLGFLGFVTSRSAIESSLKTHPKEFRIRISGRNKFVSRKGE